MRPLLSIALWLNGPGFIPMQFVLAAFMGFAFVMAWAGA